MATASRRPTVVRDQDKPAPINFDLDALDREGSPDPFVAKIAGRRIEFRDAMDIDWQDLALINSDRALFRRIVPEKDQEHFFAQAIPQWKVNQLAQAYRDHYG